CGYISIPSCGGKPAGKNKNRMNPREQLSEFGARVRRWIEDWTTLEGGHRTYEELALELFGLQFQGNEPYRRFCLARRRSPENIEHWSAIPAVPAAGFKEQQLSGLS